MLLLLDVRNLRVHFFTRGSAVHAVNRVSFWLNEGETLGIVRESGSGRSGTTRSILPPILQTPGRIT
ncbi:MAG: hypothetical protein J7452_13525 [Thermoflexus sp.]|jgi:peptide/nickel transport system ATP-binding protein/oligopeptide transport system ATP-binding protein|nr:hypothetical protein [Thermoflexus sp.]